MKKSFILSVLVFSIITLFGQNTYRTAKEIKVDVIHNKVDLNFKQAERAVIGNVSLTFKPHFYETDHVVLDAKDSTSFKILKVTFESKSGTKNLIPKEDYFFEDLEHLKIKLGGSFSKDEILKLTINYEARPYSRELPKGITDRGCFFINHDGKLDGVPKQIWTQGETEWNSCWMPIIDAPNQRYSQELSLTVEDEYVTQSNGELVKSVKNLDGTRTDIWQLDKAHPPYLTAFVVGEFAIIKDYYKDIELKFLIEKEFEQEATNIFGKTKEMMAFFEEYFGVPYPWGKSYGQVVIRGFSSTGMENTGCVTYDDRVQITKTEALDKNHGFEYVIAHELAHMWFGDLLTCEDWSQLALNESFATLAEYLWFEHKYGKLEADQYYFDVLRQYYFDERDVHEFPAIRYNYPIPDKMVNSLVYEKGANILQMLRRLIGEDAFKASLKFYLQENQFSAVEIDELRMAFEEVSGKDLKPFFNYFTSSGHPTGNIHFEFDEKKVKINFDSMTNVPISGLEGTLRLYFDDGSIIDEKQKIYGDGMFFFQYSGKPIGATFEPEGMQLGEFAEKKDVSAWAAQLKFDTFYYARISAIRNLGKHLNNQKAATALIEILHDDFWAFRLEATREILKFPYPLNPKVIGQILNLAEHDEKAQIRWEILEAFSNPVKTAYLESIGMLSQLKSLAMKLSDDPSYKVQAKAILFLNDVAQKETLAIAKSKVNSKSIVLLQSVAKVMMDGDKEGKRLTEVISILSRIRERRLELDHLTEFSNYIKKLKKVGGTEKAVQSGIRFLIDRAENGIYVQTRNKALDLLYDFKEEKEVINLTLRLLNNESYSEHKEKLIKILD